MDHITKSPFSETILEEETIPIKGTTKLIIGDPFYLKALEQKTIKPHERDYVFTGNIVAAPFGLLQIQKIRTVFNNTASFDAICATIVQAKDETLLPVYLIGGYARGKLKQDYILTCETDKFLVKTKFSEIMFKTVSDSAYGTLKQYRQYYGMTLHLWFDTDLYDMNSVKTHILTLFPEDKSR